MTQDGRWKLKYNEVMSFMEKEYRKLSKYYPKEKLMFHFIHHNRKQYNVGKHPTPILAVWTISATFAPC